MSTLHRILVIVIVVGSSLLVRKRSPQARKKERFLDSGASDLRELLWNSDLDPLATTIGYASALDLA